MTIISNNEIARAIYLGSKDKNEIEQNIFFKNVLSFLYRRRLLSKSADILKSLKNVINRENNVLEVKVYSKEKLDHVVKKDLAQILKKKYGDKEIIFIESLDEKLLGGLKIEVQDELIDLTLRNKIYKLQEYLTENHE